MTVQGDRAAYTRISAGTESIVSERICGACGEQRKGEVLQCMTLDQRSLSLARISL